MKARSRGACVFVLRPIGHRTVQMAREVMAGVFVRRPHHTHPLLRPLSHSLSLPHCGCAVSTTARHTGRRGSGSGNGGGMVGSAAYSASAIVVVMAKGKGKGGRGGSSGANKVSERRPPRITSNVKQSLRILKFWKDYERRQTSGPQPATRYRKKKVIKEVLPDDTDFYEDASSTLHYTNQGLEIASPVILVDGYNVCGYWGKLKKDFMNGRQEIARQMLIDELVSFSAVREIKVVVVFDAAASGLSTHKETYKGVDVVYSGDLSADSWIEKEVEALVADGCPKVWVVTSDALEQQLAHGEGALIWSSKRLVKEIKESEKEFDEELKEIRSTSLQGKLFQHKLKPKVVHALKDLRNKLEEEERRKR